jgi:hypothetical protein
MLLSPLEATESKENELQGKTLDQFMNGCRIEITIASDNFVDYTKKNNVLMWF